MFGNQILNGYFHIGSKATKPGAAARKTTENKIGKYAKLAVFGQAYHLGM